MGSHGGHSAPCPLSCDDGGGGGGDDGGLWYAHGPAHAPWEAAHLTV